MSGENARIVEPEWILILRRLGCLEFCGEEESKQCQNLSG